MFRTVRILVCTVLGLVVGYFWLQCALERDRNRGTNVLTWHRAGLMCSGHDGVIRCDRSWCRECGGAYGFHKERCSFRTQPPARTPRGERIVHTLGRAFFMWEAQEGTTFATICAPFWLVFVLLVLYPADAAWSGIHARRWNKRMQVDGSAAPVAAVGRSEATDSERTGKPYCLRARCTKLIRKYVITILSIASAQLSYDWMMNSAWLGGLGESFHRNLFCVLPLIVDTSSSWKWPAIFQKAMPAHGVPMVIMLPVWMTISGLAAYPAVTLIRGPLCRWRRRRRGLCTRCGYDLTGNASGRCPECGSGVSALG